VEGGEYIMSFRGFRIIVITLFLWTVSPFANGAELDVSELIAGMKSAIVEAQKTAAPPYMNLPWIEGEISYIVKKEGDAGFKLFVVTAEGKYATEAVQHVKFRLEPPSGKAWRVELPEAVIKDAWVSGVDTVAKKVFISTEGEKSQVAYPIKVVSDTKITDYKGVIEKLADIKAGNKVTVHYSPEPEGLLKALFIIQGPQKMEK